MPALSLPLNGCGDSPDTAPTHPDIASSSREATASSTAQQTWTLRSDEPEDVSLAAGDYALTINGAADKLAVVRAPKGFTVADLAEALVTQKGGPDLDPRSGHDRRSLRAVPRVPGLGWSRRRGLRRPGLRHLHHGPGGWYLEASREQAGIWILDVDGDRVVLAWVAMPGVTRSHMDDMTDMVESTRFVEPG